MKILARASYKPSLPTSQASPCLKTIDTSVHKPLQCLEVGNFSAEKADRCCHGPRPLNHTAIKGLSHKPEDIAPLAGSGVAPASHTLA